MALSAIVASRAGGRKRAGGSLVLWYPQLAHDARGRSVVTRGCVHEEGPARIFRDDKRGVHRKDESSKLSLT
jgi:hypothetical protein